MLIDIDYEGASAQPVQAEGASPIEAGEFLGLHPGPRLLVTGAVHGNEICGPQAIAAPSPIAAPANSRSGAGRSPSFRS